MNIASNVHIGDGVKLQNNVSVYEGVELEDYVFCGPSTVFTNDLTPRARFPKGTANYKKTLIKHDATLGANCTIVCGHTVGAYATVAAGAVVTKDVPPHALVAGVPAKHIGWVCRCGQVLNKALCCPDCGKGTRRWKNALFSTRRPQGEGKCSCSDAAFPKGGGVIWQAVGPWQFYLIRRRIGKHMIPAAV